MLDPTERGILGQQNIVVSTGTWPRCYGDTFAFRFLIVRGIRMLLHLISRRNRVSVNVSSSHQPPPSPLITSQPSGNLRPHLREGWRAPRHEAPTTSPCNTWPEHHVHLQQVFVWCQQLPGSALRLSWQWWGGALTCIAPDQPAPTATRSCAKGRCRCGGDTAPAGAGTDLQSCALPRGLGLSRQHPDSCL